MTAIEFNFTDNTGAPDNGTVTFTPTRNNRHSHGVTLPEPFAVSIPNDGTFTADLKPTPPHWVWRINVQVNGLPWTTNYYYIPNRNWPIRYEDLTPVDPSTVQTGLNPEPAWWEAVRAAKASADEISELAYNVREEFSEISENSSNLKNELVEALETLSEKANTIAMSVARNEVILAEIHSIREEIVEE